MHVYTALGDCYFNLEDYLSATSYYNYNEALLCPDAVECGYVWLGLGQSFYELENMEKAKDALMSAYMLEGKEIFEDVDENILASSKIICNVSLNNLFILANKILSIKQIGNRFSLPCNTPHIILQSDLNHTVK